MSFRPSRLPRAIATDMRRSQLAPPEPAKANVLELPVADSLSSQRRPVCVAIVAQVMYVGGAEQWIANLAYWLDLDQAVVTQVIVLFPNAINPRTGRRLTVSVDWRIGFRSARWIAERSTTMTKASTRFAIQLQSLREPRRLATEVLKIAVHGTPNPRSHRGIQHPPINPTPQSSRRDYRRGPLNLDGNGRASWRTIRFGR
jgi:hypothetical protein